MDRKKYIKKMKSETSEIDMNWITKVLKDSVNSNLSDGNPRGHRNLIIVMEELAELSQAIAKELRNKGDKVNLLEELGDVQLGIYYVQEICRISDEELHKSMNVKMRRLEEALAEKGEYK